MLSDKFPSAEDRISMKNMVLFKPFPMKLRIIIASSLTFEQIRQLNDNLVSAIKRSEAFAIGADSAKLHYYRIAKRLKYHESIIALALDDNQIIGSMYATFSTFPTRRNLAKFNKLTVNPDYRGQKIATKLFIILEEAVRKRGKTVSGFYCHADNPARNLYRAMGYDEQVRSKATYCLVSLTKNLKPTSSRR